MLALFALYDLELCVQTRFDEAPLHEVREDQPEW
jgi:HTH-type transcriptional regulator/antitoxin HipB